MEAGAEVAVGNNGDSVLLNVTVTSQGSRRLWEAAWVESTSADGTLQHTWPILVSPQ